MDHIQLLERLVAIDSVNPGLVPGAAGEGRIAEFVAGWMRDAGIGVEIEYAAPGRPNVIGVVPGTSGGRSLMLNAHMDTVGTGGMTDPLRPRVEDGRLYGRGAYDMKGSLASVLIAAAEIAHNPIGGDLIVTVVCDEEYASIGTASVLQRWRADAAIVTEPTGLDVCIAHKGFVWMDIQSEGVAAHGSRPDLGVDAITDMGPILVGIGELDRALRHTRRHALLGSGSIHASLIAGGEELSTYPAHCRVSVERRTVPGETAGQAEREIAEILARAAGADRVSKYTLRTTLERPPFEVGEDQEIVCTVRREVHAATGREPRLYGETPWFDSALIAGAGIPCVIFGPGGSGAHADIEYSELNDVKACAQTLVRAAAAFCRRGVTASS